MHGFFGVAVIANHTGDYFQAGERIFDGFYSTSMISVRLALCHAVLAFKDVIPFRVDFSVRLGMKLFH